MQYGTHDPKCKGPMQVIALIDDPAVVRRIPYSYPGNPGPGIAEPAGLNIIGIVRDNFNPDISIREQ